MKVMFACLADNAHEDASGKLNVIGVFDKIHSRTFPTMHRGMSLVFRLQFEFEDNGRTHEVVIRLLDEDHNEAASFVASLTCSDTAPGAFGSANQIINMANVGFHRPGRYEFRIRPDGGEESVVPFEMVAISAVAAA
jgi:hypothetical protein